MVAHSRSYLSCLNMHEQVFSAIYSTFFHCLGNQQKHNSGAQIPYLEEKSEKNDYRLETFRK